MWPVTPPRRRCSRPRLRPLLALASVALTLPLLAGCSPWEETDAPSGTPRAGAGTLAAPGSPGTAFTYDPVQAPEGATMRVEFAATAGGTTATLTVDGLQPDRGYAAHGHVNPCGPTGADAGPHYQSRPDPMALSTAPSVDPEYANPQNEYWLDVRTDASGAGTSSTVVPFPISVDNPGSVVLHEEMETMTGPGVAGTAGDRLACLTVG